MKPVISLENVSKFYTSAANVVVGLDSVQLSFRRGEFVAITGESGSGKTTLSGVLCGILGYESGELLFEGRPTSHYDSSDWERYRRDHISYISQDYGILPGATVLTNVVSALRLAGVEKTAAKARARRALEALDLWPLRGRRAGRLSSGQKQRLSIARALAKPAPVLIADEPTGNLDPENSARVIALLAEEAKHRLVLLVTHEFEEVKDYATRHIRLQDGAVVVDAALRPANEPEELPAVPAAEKPKASLFVTGLQLRSRPVWSGLVTLLFTLTAFAAVAFLGTFITVLDDTNTRIYDPSAFVNGDPCRIVVSRADLQPMTGADYARLAEMKFVRQVERNGYVADAQYAYREGVDYTTIRTEKVYAAGGNVINQVVITYRVYDSAPFVQLVPVLPEGQRFLQTGRLPADFYEVVAHRDTGYQVGDRVSVFLTTGRYWSLNTALKLEYTVVGLTDHGSGLYFSDAVGRFFQHIAHSSGSSEYYQFLPVYDGLMTPLSSLDGIPAGQIPAELSDRLQDGECIVSGSLEVSVGQDEVIKDNVIINYRVFQAPNINLERAGQDPLLIKNRVTLTTPKKYTLVYDDPDTGEQILRTVGMTPSHTLEMFGRLMFVTPNTFDQLCWNEDSEQVSLTIGHYAYTQRVLDALEEAGYIGISPYRMGAGEADETLAQQRRQTMSICLLALVALVALQIVVLRALFGVQLPAYRLLRNIGLVRAGARRSVLWQFLLFTALGQLLAGGALWACRAGGVAMVTRVLPYLPPLTMAVLSAVHLAAAMTAAWWTVRTLEKQVYPVSERFADLPMDEEVTA